MFSKKNIKHAINHGLFRNCIYGLVLLAMVCRAYASELTASVDRDSIGARETITLTLSVEGDSQGSPDFSGLKNDFAILSNQKSASTQIINGRRQSSIDWQLTLAPKHSGRLLIPSFTVGKAVSDAIEINVSSQSQIPQTGSDEQVKTSINTDKDSVYVQEQILVSIKLITEVDLSQAKFEPLDVKNAMVVDLGQKKYQTSANGKPQLVVENNFAIFPQQSGELIIPSLNYQYEVANRRSMIDRVYGRNQDSFEELHTDEKRIQVKAIPAQSNSKTWQAAENFTLSESWSGSLDHLKIGEPITRTVTISGDAMTAGLIIPLATPEIDGLTFYPEQAQTNDNKSKNGVMGSRVETMTIIPNNGGDFVLPAINLDWWNTKTQKMERVSLPEKKLHVIGELAKAQPPVAPLPPTSASAPAAETSAALPPPPLSNNLPAWIWAVVGLLLMVLTALAVYAMKLKKNISHLQQDQEDRDNALQAKERDIWDALKATAATRDAKALRKAVLNWAQFQWPTERVNTLDDIAKLAVSEELTAALKALDEVLYSNHSHDEWDASALLKLLNEFRKQRKIEKKSPELKNLYRQ